ncbi:MAG: metallophosphoesterase family protein [Candidatus Gastranaerophilaceae bacterium]
MKSFLKLFFLIVCVISTQIANAKDFKFIQVTDLNFENNEMSISSLDRLIKDINQTRDLDFVVFTGDNIKNSNKTDMKEFLKKTRKINAPYYVLLGDTDCSRTGLRKADAIKLISGNSLSKKTTANKIVKKGDLVLIFPDGTKEMINMGGYYKPETMAWLDKKLNKYKNRNVLIFQHFPLVMLNDSSMKNLHKRKEYIKLINGHNNVKAVFTGHFNTNSETQLGNTMHYVTQAAGGAAPAYRLVVMKNVGNNKYDIYTQIVGF